jgi:hypothetical protein
MAVSLNTNSSFVIDGFETNAGARVFLKNAVFHIIDGADAGSAAERSFLKDHRVFVVDGGRRLLGAGLLGTTAYVVTGRPPPGSVHLNPMTYVVSGRASPGTVNMPSSAFFAIDLE